VRATLPLQGFVFDAGRFDAETRRDFNP